MLITRFACIDMEICEFVNNNKIIINKFILNSTELDSHIIYSTCKHMEYKAIQMRRYVIRHSIHTKSYIFR